MIRALRIGLMAMVPSKNKQTLLTGFVFLAISFFSLRCDAQYDELGLQVGASRYKGELSPYLFDTRFIHPAVGIFYRHNWTRHWGWKLELNYGRVSGNDNTQKGFERIRNLNFYSDIIEVSPTIEFNFFPFETGNPEYPFTPFVFGGLTVFKFNPKTHLNNQTIELQPLGTEGQGLPGRSSFYHRLAVAIPFGGGIKASAGSFAFTLQVSAHRTYTDYLDDVSTTYPDLVLLQQKRGTLAAYLSDPALLRDSIPALEGKQRGNSTDKDWYVFAMVGIDVRLNSMLSEICKPFKRRRYS